MSKDIRVLVNTGNKASSPIFDVVPGGGAKNQVARVKAIPGARYQFEDAVAQNAGPEKIRSQRVGKDLHVMLDGNAEADLIVENYYDDTLLTDNNRGLYGRADDGKLYEYISADADPSGLPINLADGGQPMSQVLGERQIAEEFVSAYFSAAAPGVGGWVAEAAALGSAAVVAVGGSMPSVLDTSAAAVPTGVRVSANGTVVTGVAEVGVTVTVTAVDGTVLGTAVAGADSRFSVSLSRAQTDGQIVSVTASDAGGTSVAVTVSAPDTTAPATPASAPVGHVDDVGWVQSAASTALATDDAMPGILIGQNLSDTPPKLYVDGVHVAATYDPVTGTLTPLSALTQGAHAIRYTLTDTAGNESGQSPALNLTVNTDIPVLTIAQVAGDAVGAADSGTFDGLERGASLTTVVTLPVISGTSDYLDGQTVTVTVNNTDYTATVQSGGAWSVALTNAGALALNHGNTYSVYVSGSNQAGNVASDHNNSLIVNTAQPDVPTVLNRFASTTTPTLSGLAQKFDPNNPGNLIALVSGDSLSVTVNDTTVGGVIGSLPVGLSYDAVSKQWHLDTAAAGSLGVTAAPSISPPWWPTARP